jgi:hypothetical protein
MLSVLRNGPAVATATAEVPYRGGRSAGYSDARVGEIERPGP